MGSYFVVRPVRDAMGTVYGVDNLEELYTGTFIASFFLAPAYAFLASRIKLSTFLPWVYGFIAVTMLGFYALFQSFGQQQDRWVAAAFFIWVSTFNVLIISVFWSLMADTFSRTQAKRLFGFVAAGGTVGTIGGPALAALLVERRRHEHADADLGGRLRRHRLAGADARAGEATTARRRARRADDDAGSQAGRQSARGLHAAVPVALPADDRPVHPADDHDLHDHLLPARRPHHQGVREPRGADPRLRDDRSRREQHHRVPAALRHRPPDRALRGHRGPAS